jgi:exodeoxyribonuclease III
MKIISWNVNGLRAVVRKEHFAWLFDSGADIFCLQETKAHPDDLPEDVKSPKGYHVYFDHSKTRKGYSGVAVYSKIEPDKVEYALNVKGKPELDQEGRFIALHFKDFVLCNVYFPNGGGGPERLSYKFSFYDAFLTYIKKLRSNGKKVLFCGDVNTAHEKIDLARPKENEKNTGFLPEERAWIDEVERAGFVDVFRRFYPGRTGAYTYWDMKTFARERNVGWRIDYFFVSEDLMGKVKNTAILSDVIGSDHCPIEIVL